MSRLLSSSILCLALAVSSMPNAARAEGVRDAGGLLDRSPQSRSNMLSFFGFVPWFYGVGVGAAVRYSLPVVPQGFIPKLNDSFELEFGADLAYERWNGWDYLGIAAPVVEARWTFHVTRRLAAYGKVSAGVWLHKSEYGRLQVNAYHNVGPGILFKLNDTLSLRGEFGYAGGRLGVGLTF